MHMLANNNALTALPHVVFIGGGNMTRAIVGGMLTDANAHPTSFKVSVVQRSDPNKQALLNDFAGLGLDVVTTVDQLSLPANIVVWAVKPQVLKQVVLANQHVFGPGVLHVSVAAGVPTHALSAWLANPHVVRCMPNTPSTVGMGAAGLFACDAVTTEQRRQVELILKATGLLVWVDSESQLEAVTAVSGSGPAYFFYFIQAMADAGQAMGLPAHTALALAIATARGAAELATRSEETPAQLQQRVTSKGGATFEAIAVFNQAQLASTIARAMAACSARATAMGNEFGTV
tara:strand:+ start:417 stop:1286 length:870 start_codon:yes stop_codon:yes gene_type:complete